jgi:DMSO/TMAO reductase YedYZ molybdopterin-dependent catalytic subunit
MRLLCRLDEKEQAMTRKLLTRRSALTGLVGGGGLLLSGCERIVQIPGALSVLESAEQLSQHTQRAILGERRPLAREYQRADISRNFKANGTVRPQTEDYVRHVLTEFTQYRLKIDGLVARPLELSLEQIRGLPSRTQITRHDCVEGWSAIGEWTGVPLSYLLQMAGLGTGTRYLVFHCADNLAGQGLYYESIDLVDAYHPQTIMAYAMNGQTLPIPHGAPLRLRVERQLGYKMAKYVMKIDAVDSFAALGRGKGGYWPDRGYEWYAGI